MKAKKNNSQNIKSELRKSLEPTIELLLPRDLDHGGPFDRGHSLRTKISVTADSSVTVPLAHRCSLPPSAVNIPCWLDAVDCERQTRVLSIWF